MFVIALFSVLPACLKYFMGFVFKDLGVKDTISTYQPVLCTRTAGRAQTISVPKKKKKKRQGSKVTAT